MSMAKWIWLDNQKENMRVVFKKHFELDFIPTSAIASISADSKYQLWVNGVRVVFDGSLKRGPNRNDTYYDQIDISEYLTIGTNDITTGVWYFGKSGFSHNDSTKAGFIMDLEIGDINIVTDSSWKVLEHPAFLQDEEKPNFRLSENHIYFDARLDIGKFYAPDYKPSNWQNATEIALWGESPYNNMVMRPIPMHINYGLVDYISTEKEGNTIVCRLPYGCHISPCIKVNAPAGKKIKILTDTDNQESLHATYITKEGKQKYEVSDWLSGENVYYIIEDGIEVLYVKYRQTGYDTSFDGSFSCSDERLNLLWQKSVRTLYMTMRDTYMDCPDRERAQWWGDAVNEIEMAFYSLSPSSHLLGRKGIMNMVDWRTEEGALATISPSGSQFFELPVQQLAGVCGVFNYYMHTGDVDIVKYAYPHLKSYVNLWQFGDNVLPEIRKGSWYWLDWGENIDAKLLEHAWFFLALTNIINMASVLGFKEDIKHYNKIQDKMRSVFDQTYWTGTEYRSSDYEGDTDDRANAMVVLCGLADDKAVALKKVFSEHKNASPYMEKYVLQAMCELGYVKEAMKRAKKRFAGMLDDDCSTLWELFKKEDGTQNHAWSGGALTIMSKYVAGISLISPAYKKFYVYPELSVGLDYITARVSTVKGIIKVSATPSTLEVNVPQGTTAYVRMPKTKLAINGRLVFAGITPFAAIDGAKYDGQDSKFVYYKLMSGHWKLDGE